MCRQPDNPLCSGKMAAAEGLIPRNPHPRFARRRPAEQPSLAASPTVTRQTPRVIIGLWPHTSPVTSSHSFLVNTLYNLRLCGVLCPCNVASTGEILGPTFCRHSRSSFIKEASEAKCCMSRDRTSPSLQATTFNITSLSHSSRFCGSSSRLHGPGADSASGLW